MKNFFFNNLSNPRMTTIELIEVLREESMFLSKVTYSKPKYYETRRYFEKTSRDCRYCTKK